MTDDEDIAELMKCTKPVLVDQLRDAYTEIDRLEQLAQDLITIHETETVHRESSRIGLELERQREWNEFLREELEARR